MSALLPIPGRAAERRVLKAAGFLTVATGVAWAVATAVTWTGERITAALESFTFGPSLPLAVVAVILLAGWHRAFRMGRAKQRIAHAIKVWEGHPR